jgi:hypothetical protein
MYYNGFYFYFFPLRSLHSGAPSIHVSHFCVGWERGVQLVLYFLLLLSLYIEKSLAYARLVD